VLPPLFGVTMALLVFRLINRAWFARLETAGQRAVGQHHRLRHARATLEEYGLGWTVPFAAITAFVLAVFAGGTLLVMIAVSLPPKVDLDDGPLVTPQIERDDRLLLVRKYPGVDNYRRAYDLAVKARAMEGKKSGTLGTDVLKPLLHLPKYLAVVALLAWITSLGQRGGRGPKFLRLLAVLSACAVFWGLAAAGYIRASQSAYENEWKDIRSGLEVEGYRQDVPRPTEDERDKIRDVPQPRWWNISAQKGD
jgi:hypothetical protein